MKKILLFLLLMPFTLSLTDDFFYSESLLLDIRTTSYFESSNDIKWVKTNINYFPENSFNQEVIFIKTEPEAEYNDTHYNFFFDNPNKLNSFELVSRVRTYNRFLPVDKKITFPFDEKSEYLKSTEKIDINEDIIRQASQIVEGEDDLYKAVFKLAAWTKDNINYSLNSVTIDASKSASWVLENRYGVCDELTNLFIAFCRSLGIPARFVSGISYTNSELFEKPWGLHGWAEVYFPGYGWMPFDPTYGQFGFIDGGHIKLKHSIDSDKTSTRYEWLGNGKITPKDLDIDVNVIETGKKITDPVEIEIYPYKNEVDFESYNIIIAEITNKKNNYIGLELEISAPLEIEIKEKKIYVALEPKETKKVAWIVRVGKLNSGYIYTFPLSARNSLGFIHETSFKSVKNSVNLEKNQADVIYKNIVNEKSKTSPGKIELNCKGPSFSYNNESFDINCEAKNTGNIMLENVKLCLDNCINMDLGINQKKDHVFKKRILKNGINIITITAKNSYAEDIYNIEVIIEEKPKLEISKVNFPDELSYEDFDINFEIFNDKSKAYNSTVIFYFNGRDTGWKFNEIENNQKFSVSLNKNAIQKNNALRIYTTYHDMHGRKYESEYLKEIKATPKGFEKILLILNELSNAIDRKIKIAFARIGI